MSEKETEKPAFREHEEFNRWLEGLAIELQRLKDVHKRQITSLLTRHSNVIGRLTVTQADEAFTRLQRDHLITADEWMRVRMLGRGEMPKWLFSRPRAISTRTWVKLTEATRVQLRNPDLKVDVRRLNQTVRVVPDRITDGEWRKIVWPSDPHSGIRPVDSRDGPPNPRAPEYYNEIDVIPDPQFPDHIIIVAGRGERRIKIRVAFVDHARRLNQIGFRDASGSAAN